MNRNIPPNLRKAVAQRAGYRCEYCLTSEADSVLSFEIDHAFPRKHGGPTTLDNLAYTCIICNRNKGTNIATAEYPSKKIIPLFNPRSDLWSDHFEIDEGEIIGKTEVARATIKILDLNHIDRIIERRIQIQSGSYPA